MNKPTDNNSPQARLRHHVTGAIERGEATPIVEQTTDNSIPEASTTELLTQIYNLQQQRDAAVAALRECQTSEWSLTFASPNRPSPIARLAEINKIVSAAIAAAEKGQS